MNDYRNNNYKEQQNNAPVKKFDQHNQNNVARREGYSFFSPLLNLFDIPDFFDSEEVDVLRTDVKDAGDKYALEMEVPGIDKKDVKIAVKNGYLVVSAKFSRKEDDPSKKYIHFERESGSYTRSFYVGNHLTTKDITAKIENGMLYIDVPKKTAKDESEDYVQIQ